MWCLILDATVLPAHMTSRPRNFLLRHILLLLLLVRLLEIALQIRLLLLRLLLLLLQTSIRPGHAIVNAPHFDVGIRLGPYVLLTCIRNLLPLILRLLLLL